MGSGLFCWCLGGLGLCLCLGGYVVCWVDV